MMTCEKCVENWNGRCTVEECKGPIIALDMKPVVSSGDAAERYMLFAELLDLEID